MKKQAIASTMGIFALIASSTWTPVQASPMFTPSSGNGTPSQATGGASRSSMFTNRQNRTVRQATGGASRGSIFQPGANRRVRAAVGGASRGGFFQPSRTNRAPRAAAGGASRLGRQELDPSLVASSGPAAMLALTPQNYYGTTVAERPTILVYLPATDAEEAVFSLKDEAGTTIYEATIAINREAGIRAISLPASAPALEVGKNYQWFMALKIDEKLSPSAPYVDGWIQRVSISADMASNLKQADALQKAKILGQNGHWYDCVAALAMLRANQPTDQVLAKHWSELLSSVELNSIEQAPMLTSLK